MPKLTFALDFKTDTLKTIDVPVEIRRIDSALVATTLVSQSVELPHGRYYASARMPGGQRLVEPFEIVANPVELRLAPDVEDESPHAWEETAHYLERPKRPRSAQVGNVRAKVRVFSGNALAGRMDQENARASLTLEHFAGGRVAQLRSHGDRLLLVQLIEPGGPVHNMMLPTGNRTPARVIFTRRADGSCAMEGHLVHNVADVLLQRCGEAASAEASEITRSAMLRAEDLVGAKANDPLAAIVAAYAILRFRPLTELHDWTASLYQWFPWVPDGVAIRGEHLARLGKHAEAEALFAELPGRGLPIVADGLFYATERLKLYSQLGESRRDEVNVDRAARTFAILRPFASYVHRQRPLLSYHGLDPAKPDMRAAPRDFLDANAIELATWLDDTSSISPGRAVAAT